MKELTESVIKELFVKTGVDEKYFSYYETELKRSHKAFREEYPYDENEDEEERAEDEKIEKACIECANDYIRYYVEEREKGHGNKWSDSVARDRVGGEHEFFVYINAYTSIENEAEKDKELTIHAYSLNSDPFFIEQYKRYFIDQSEYPQEDAVKYTKTYLDCLSKGKSEVYAKQYALRLVDYCESKEYCELYASKYEESINKGRDESKTIRIANEYVDLYERYWPEDDNILGIEAHEGYMKGFEYAIDNDIDSPQIFAEEYEEFYLSILFPHEKDKSLKKQWKYEEHLKKLFPNKF